ncbi:hypothetical protein ARMSODRAFT_980677 [Armillaria solidipes]|uniref:Uncharacterized protein n=1 Tax=Armillaria solidipes TaxID=1076256 RepID=A0A2H3AY02_9AGAR|nr:hypothetical protein ARMSODRAFT_980677 [Armillaria solidipes]
MDSQAMQELWARPLIPTYRIVLKYGKYTLDAYLHGLFVGYYDRFRRFLGVPENPRDLDSVLAWKRRALAKLALLMIRMHDELLQSSPPIPNPSQQDLQSHDDKPLEGPSSPEPLVSSGQGLSASHHDADDAEKNTSLPAMAAQDTQIREPDCRSTTAVTSEPPAVSNKRARSSSIDGDDEAEVSTKRYCWSIATELRIYQSIPKNSAKMAFSRRLIPEINISSGIDYLCCAGSPPLSNCIGLFPVTRLSKLGMRGARS